MSMKYLMGFLFFFIFSSVFAETQTCQEIVNQPSQAWINKESSQQGGNTVALVAAISHYGKCVDKNTKALYNSMLKIGNYPLMGANGEFGDFSNALKSFTDLALKYTAKGGSWDNTQAAYADLYQKQFKLLFYSFYLTPAQAKNSAVLNRINNTPRPSLKSSQVYMEKLLKQFPLDKRQKLSSAFNQMIKGNGFALNSTVNQEFIYDYAIFLLQSPSDKPYSEAPF